MILGTVIGKSAQISHFLNSECGDDLTILSILSRIFRVVPWVDFWVVFWIVSLELLPRLSSSLRLVPVVLLIRENVNIKIVFDF